MALTDKQLEIISEAIQPLFQYLEKEVIADIARRIKKTLTYTRTAELQAMSMQKLGYSPAKIRKEAMKLLNTDAKFRKEVAKNTLEYKRQVRDIIQNITKEAHKANDEIVANAGNMAWVNDLSVWKSAGKDLTDNSFLQQLIESFAAQTADTLRNMTQTTGFKMMSGYAAVEDAYRRELDKAVIKICTGTFSQDKVVKDVVHNLAQSGLRSIDFSSGYSMQLDTAARLALRTGSHQLAGKITDNNIEQTGENLVYVSKHWGARNTGTGHANHEQWQGKVYFIKEGHDYTKEADRIGQNRIMSLWYATGYSADGTMENDPLGLNGYNCRHTHHPWFEGVSVFPKESPEPADVTINGKRYDYYAATQKIRSMERAVRALKREKEALKALNMDTAEIDAKISRKTREYKDFCEMCGINPRNGSLRYECGSSDIKKTKAWKQFETAALDKRIDFGRIKNVKFEKTAQKTVISKENVLKIKEAITRLGQEYDIHLDYFEVGNYTEGDYRNIPLFFRAINDRGTYKSKLVLNNASFFWSDTSYQNVILNSGYFAGNTIEDFVEHELAHVMTFQHCKTMEDYERVEAMIHPMFTNGVSEYSWASKDGAEIIAEAFVKVRKGKKVSNKVKNMLNEYTEVWKND